MKKLIITAFFILVLVCTSSNMVFAHSKNVNEVAPEQILKEAVINFEGSDNYTLNKKDLYDLHFNLIGYAYELQINGFNSFAIVISENNNFVVEEYYSDVISPYINSEFCIYGGNMTYLEYDNGYILDAISKKPIFNVNNYGGNVLLSNSVNEIYYENKTVTSNTLSLGLPNYLQCSYENACANIAGGIVIGYFDAFIAEMIPGYNAFYAGGYVAETERTKGVIDQLYFDMNTSANKGTTYSDFKSGLQKYVNRANRNVTYTELASKGKLNFEEYKVKVRQERPVVLFLNKYNAIDVMIEENGYDFISTNYYGGTHTMVASGYKFIDYYRTEVKSIWSPVWYNPFRYIKKEEVVNFRTDNYIAVNTIIAGIPKGYLRLDDNCKLDYALTVDIY